MTYRTSFANFILILSLHIFSLKHFFLCPRDRRSGGILFLSCLSFCHSVILSFCRSVFLSETLTLLIIFEQWVLELWYFIWVFLVLRPFRGYHYFWRCDLDLCSFFEIFNLAYYFWTVGARALIFHMSIPCDKTFSWVLNLLFLTFDQLKKDTLVITSEK